MLTIRDVAKFCNVSTATVSKAFNEDSDISYETVERVRAAARSLGYFPNAAARSLKTRRAYNLGLLTQMQHQNGLSTEFITRVINAFQAEAENNSYDVTFVSKSLSGKPVSYEEHCRYRNFEGVALICANFLSPQVTEFLQKDIPCVTVDHRCDRHSSVMTDNQDAYGQLVDYVYRRGHRRIAVVRNNTTTIADFRFECFRKACAEHGLELREEAVTTAIFNDVESADQATLKLLALPERPTCIFYPDDISCVAGIDTLRRAGLSVPEDVSVVGFDGIQLSQIIYPRLTTYRQDMEAIGRSALHLLLAEMEGGENARPQQRNIRGEFLPGETVAAL